ncbi:ankyrin repeat-containing domain protein [Coniochaeta sp. 2T2.1]|nr:ankyrin repeat-containing domain protein [Coniochaeta sp. 2T2.1]
MATSFSLLHVASARGHPDIIRWLIEQEVAVDNESRGLTPCRETDHPWDCQSLDLRRPWTPLELALCYRRNDSARILIGNGAAMGNGQRDLPGSSALNIAVQHGCIDIVRQLLESSDYDVNALDEHGQLAVNIAASITPFRFDSEALRITLEPGADLAIETLYRLDSLVFSGMPALPLHQAIVCGNHGAAMMMVDAGADVNAVSGGYRPLHCVFLADSMECGGVRLTVTERVHWRATRLRLLERLLMEGADPNAKSGGGSVPDDFLTGITPLLLAAGNATCPASIQLLLQYGADVNALDDNEENALQWVISPPIFTHCYIRNVVRRRGSEPQVDAVVRLLIDSGCDARHTDMLGLCCVDRFARFDRTMEALPALLQSLGLKRIQCDLSSGLRESLGSGLFDNARLFVRLGGGVSEAEVLAICDRYSEENGVEDPRAVMEFLRGMHRFSRELEILGTVLERDLKYRFRRALDSQVT